MQGTSKYAACCAIAAVASLLTVARAETVTFQQDASGYVSTVDTFLKQADPSSSFGGSTIVEWDGEDGGGQNIGLLRFDNIFGGGVGQIPIGVQINSASLTYTVTNAGNDCTVNELVIDWSEADTFNSFGGDAGLQTDEYGNQIAIAAGSAGTHTIDVTASLISWAADPSLNHGWVFRPTGGTDGVEFLSSENATALSRPKLTVSYTLLTKVDISPSQINAVVGANNQALTVSIPPASNQTQDVHVTLTSDQPAVAAFTGGSSSVLLTFPAGGAATQGTIIDIGQAGTASITSTNDAALDEDQATVTVDTGQVFLNEDVLHGIEATMYPLTVSISSGSNDTRSITVTLTTTDENIVTMAGSTSGTLDLVFSAGASTSQKVMLNIGNTGSASISSTNNATLANTAISVNVGTGFHFTATADPRSEATRWDHVLAGINTYIGGPGEFHVSPGDVDPIPPLRSVIDTRFGSDFLWYPIVGNHEAETAEDMTWLRNEYHTGNGVRTPLKQFTNQDGPSSAEETIYTWDFGNAHFIALNQYWNGISDTGTNGDIVPALYNWLAADLAANTQPVVFVFGHEPAFPFHRHVGDSLDAYPANRDAFWSLLEDNGVQAYICGHTHVYSKYQPNPDKTWQLDVGNAGNDSSSAPDNQTFADVTVSETAVRFDVWQSTTMGGTEFEMIDSWSVPIELLMQLSPAVIDHSIDRGTALPDENVDLTPSGPGTINFTVTENADWLTVAPTSGQTTDTPVTLALTYDVAALPAGSYTATVTVTSNDVANSPQYVTVNVEILSVLPDLDLDSDVDMTDFGLLQACYTNSGDPSPSIGCEEADFDNSSSVDQMDLVIFQACFSGADVPADLTCDD